MSTCVIHCQYLTVGCITFLTFLLMLHLRSSIPAIQLSVYPGSLNNVLQNQPCIWSILRIYPLTSWVIDVFATVDLRVTHNVLVCRRFTGLTKVTHWLSPLSATKRFCMASSCYLTFHKSTVLTKFHVSNKYYHVSFQNQVSSASIPPASLVCTPTMLLLMTVGN